MNDERRHFQRLTLAEPLDGWFGDYAVRLIDVSATGAQIETDEPLPSDARALLRFYWRGREVEIIAETARVNELRTGLKFVEEDETLRELIAQSAAELLRAFEANAAGERADNTIGEQTITSVSAVLGTGYVVWTFEDGAWKSKHSLLRDQPPNGFTIAAGESEEQVSMLCRTYESGDTEARKLTRMLAELSVSGS
ncbi:MAG TPA: PilZ domain-containing protein [Thermoanaerobaculia bacterium]